MIQDMTLRASVFVADAIARLRSSERGQGIMEYSILLGAIALIAAIALFAAGGLNFTRMRTEIQACIDFANSCGP
jgi:hypothetical protein